MLLDVPSGPERFYTEVQCADHQHTHCGLMQLVKDLTGNWTDHVGLAACADAIYVREALGGKAAADRGPQQ